MFNAALCAHLHAIVTGSSSGAPHRALCLYSQAYSSVMVEQHQQTLDWLLLLRHGGTSERWHWSWNEPARTTVLLQAALCHNMAAIHCDSFWNYAHARLLRCQLAAVIHWTAFSQMETEDCALQLCLNCVCVFVRAMGVVHIHICLGSHAWILVWFNGRQLCFSTWESFLLLLMISASLLQRSS